MTRPRLGALTGVVASRICGSTPRSACSADAMVISSAAFLAAVGAFAGSMPAYRASRVDPAEVLRNS
jgi:ABC-type antimicrobial peptide transport system permease subunit